MRGGARLPSHPVFAAERIEQTKREIHASNLKIACASSSANLYLENPEKRAAELRDARRFIDLAAALGSRFHLKALLL
jgi:sugar phosphate isomerase/epimerase